MKTTTTPLSESLEIGVVQLKGRRLKVLEVLAPKGVSVLEIGSYEGGSAVYWSKLGCSVMCVDPWKPYPSAPESMQTDLASGEAFRRFRKNTKNRTISYFMGTAAEFLRANYPSCVGRYDLVFVDGDHTHECVVSDLRIGATCLKDGGILCGDDFDPDYPGVISGVRKFFDRPVWEQHGIFAMVKDASYGWTEFRKGK